MGRGGIDLEKKFGKRILVLVGRELKKKIL